MKCLSKLDCLIYEMLWIKNKLGTETDHANGFHSRKTFYLNAFMPIYFLTF